MVHARWWELQLRRRTQNLVAVSIACLLSIVPVQSGLSGGLGLDLHNGNLQQQCDWAMYVDVQDVQHYLNYTGSQLHPLSKVRVTFRAMSRLNPSAAGDAQTYEKLWYYQGKPIGLRRLLQPAIATNSQGILVLAPVDSDSNHAQAVADTLVRLYVDIQLRNANTIMVLVSDENFNQIAQALGHYKFFASGTTPTSGAQMSIYLCSSDSNREEHLFLQH